MLILAHVAGAALGEEMGGPSPHPPAALAPVPVHPGFGLLQVGGRQILAGFALSRDRNAPGQSQVVACGMDGGLVEPPDVSKARV